jgi:hypothetical protein
MVPKVRANRKAATEGLRGKKISGKSPEKLSLAEHKKQQVLNKKLENELYVGVKEVEAQYER